MKRHKGAALSIGYKSKKSKLYLALIYYPNKQPNFNEFIYLFFSGLRIELSINKSGNKKIAAAVKRKKLRLETSFVLLCFLAMKSHPR